MICYQIFLVVSFLELLEFPWSDFFLALHLIDLVSSCTSGTSALVLLNVTSAYPFRLETILLRSSSLDYFCSTWVANGPACGTIPPRAYVPTLSCPNAGIGSCARFFCVLKSGNNVFLIDWCMTYWYPKQFMKMILAFLRPPSSSRRTMFPLVFWYALYSSNNLLILTI